MRRKMKKTVLYAKRNIMSAFVLLAMFLFIAGCGKVEKDRDMGGEASGDAIVVQEVPQATEEMNKENENAQKEEQVNESTVVVSPEDLNEPEIEEQAVTEAVPEQADESRLQIVFLGDSILDGYRNETGIAAITGELCNADVYNLAMGGTTAALSKYESAVFETWSSRGLQGVVNAICGNIDAGILDGFRAGEVFASCDFDKTDYFVIEYGMNDFLSAIPINNDSNTNQEYTYVGALRNAINRLRGSFPEAEIVLCSPNYAQFWGKDGAYLGDGNMVDNGGGTLAAYYRVCGNVSADENTLFLNAYEGIGLDTYTADEYLEDGIHLSEKGRRKYAEKLSEIILNYETTRNN
ncbi:MAG: SGNH/GDSL hydrolase family protein [Clostridiales bacterium]|nr:SGNH/GDSL hydrolase family protein [Clostridiales bacterium]